MISDERVKANLTLPSAGWSNRILLLALSGIFFLTLFPFRFTLHASLPPGSSPFLLGVGEKISGPLDIFLNILLFFPFGFGLSEKLREKGWTRTNAFITTWIAGSLLSYGIEFLQLYVPSRDSGWEDVVSNGTGAAVGFLIFELWGRPAVGYLAKIDVTLRKSLTPRHAALILIIYFGLWFAVSAVLETDTRLGNWSSQSELFVGGEPQTRSYSAWKGTVFQLELWNQAVAEATARALAAGEIPEGATPGLLASYDFSSSASLEDHTGFLVPLSWSPNPPSFASPRGQVFNGRYWLTSKIPVSNLVQALQKTNHFSLRVVCAAAETFSSDERIISIAQPSGVADLQLRQEGSDLVFWFRNPISVGHAQLTWYVPDTFIAGQPRDIVFSYNGSNLSLYINGTKDPHSYVLGPGTRLAKVVRRVRTVELVGYNYLYDALIFVPAGALLGIVTTRKRLRNVAGYLLLATAYLLPAWLFERILSYVSGRAISPGSVALPLVLFVAASVWINADRIRA